LKISILQETVFVKSTNTNNSSQADVVKGTINNILTNIRQKADPDELNRLKKIVRKNVPLHLRSYFTAYLLKELMGKIRDKTDVFTTLFVSIGKNRRVYPKDLADLFLQTLNLSRSDIGEIKVFDSYSFVEISLDHAANAISKLSGSNFRGRRITVNTAKKKENRKRAARS
jgi:hypothetical protein